MSRIGDYNYEQEIKVLKSGLDVLQVENHELKEEINRLKNKLGEKQDWIIEQSTWKKALLKRATNAENDLNKVRNIVEDDCNIQRYSSTPKYHPEVCVKDCVICTKEKIKSVLEPTNKSVNSVETNGKCSICEQSKAVVERYMKSGNPYKYKFGGNYLEEIKALLEGGSTNDICPFAFEPECLDKCVKDECLNYKKWKGSLEENISVGEAFEKTRDVLVERLGAEDTTYRLCSYILDALRGKGKNNE